jgi:threonylcarbamoyladenosine tRNA methylthiotransferase MtaB
MPGHLPPAVIKARAAELRQIGESKQQEYAGRFVGRELPLLIQGDGRSGITANYLTVRLDREASGEAVVRITGVNRDGSCSGELVR